MSPRPAKFTQGDVARVWRAARAAGETVKVEVRPDGTIVAIPVSRREPSADNEWDGVR